MNTKKTYTRKQIKAAIAYWEKQLKAGNYKQVNEDVGPKQEMTVQQFLDFVKTTVPKRFADAFVCFAPERNGNGKIYGQVNNLIKDGDRCMMTLAPYVNGSRKTDCSLDKYKQDPLKLVDIVRQLKSFSPSATIVVRYKDPFSVGPNAGSVVEATLKDVDLDKVFGIFMRPEEGFKPKVVERPKNDIMSMLNKH